MARPGDSSSSSSEFPAAFRRAVTSSGLSLRQLSERMQLKGHDLSVATLSYWQSGARMPSRRASLAAIGDLERTLGVARGELAARLTHDRSRRPSHDNPGVERMSTQQREPSAERIDLANATLARWGRRWDEGVRRVSLHTLVALDHSARPVREEVRELMEVVGAGAVDRVVAAYAYQDPGVGIEIVPVRGCELGRVVTDVARSITLAELLIPPTPPGASFLYDYEVRYDGPTGPVRYLTTTLATPLRELALEVAFTPGCAPATVRQVVETPGEQTSTEVPVPPEGGVTMLLLDFGPGHAGLYWDPDGAPA